MEELVDIWTQKQNMKRCLESSATMSLSERLGLKTMEMQLGSYCSERVSINVYTSH